MFLYYEYNLPPSFMTGGKRMVVISYKNSQE